MNEIQELLERALPQIAVRLENELVLTCPVDTGLLRNSITVFPNENGLLISMAEYGELVEFGTPPHIIKPQSKQALKFKPKGSKDFIFAKEVRHPGTRPNPFIRNAIQTKLKEIVIEEINKFL